MKNIFTIDLEDWYCSFPGGDVVPRSEWKTAASRAHVGVRLLLEVLRRYHTKATFFVLGCVAERDPDLVREVAAQGHEIASHGFSHHHLEILGPDGFREDLDRSLALLESITGTSIRGYRAPMFSVTKRTVHWATEILSERRIEYDSSVFPMSLHPSYGIADAAMTPFHHSNGLLELPISVAEIAGVRVPASGGAYFRHLPYAVTAALARRCNRAARPFVFYVHPWELDTDQPRIHLPLISRIRHYRGMDTMKTKLEQMMGEFEFTNAESFIANADIA